MKPQFFIPLFDPPQMLRTDAQNLGCMNPRQLFRIGS
jgi:hypothetical protein